MVPIHRPLGYGPSTLPHFSLIVELPRTGVPFAKLVSDDLEEDPDEISASDIDAFNELCLLNDSN